MKAKKDKKNMTMREKIIENINVFVSAYLIAFVIRLLLIEAYQIPSQSMVPNLLVKDILMVEKVTMGTRVPIVNWKLPGFMKPERNDIIVFVSPAWKSPGVGKEIISLLTLSLINLDNTFDTPKNLVKRLVAKPGDIISMSNSTLFINRTPVKTDFVMTAREEDYYRLNKIGYKDFNLFSESYDGKTRVVQFLLGLDLGQGGRDHAAAMERLKSDNFVNNNDLFKFLLMANFPEIRVPVKGEVINLAQANGYYKYLLKMLMERESGKTLSFVNNKFYLEGKEVTQWIPKDNYYFGMGDNRDYSEDCRYFGFIPEKNIFGKPFFRYYPFNRLGVNLSETAASAQKKGSF